MDTESQSVTENIQTTTVSSKPRSKRRPAIDVFTGFRGIAALWVFLFHRAVKSVTEVDVLHLQWLGLTGQAAVSLFFCLSGFIMVWVYGDCQFRSVTCYWSFFGRRAFRLLPLYYFSMLLSVHDARCLWGDGGVCTGLDWLAIVLTFIPIRSWTIFNISDLLWNPPLWSVQTELFFYIIFPFVLRLIRYILKTDSFDVLAKEPCKKKIYQKLTLMWFLVSLISAIPLIIRLATADRVYTPIFYRGQTVAYYTPYARAPEFILGMITGIIFIMKLPDAEEETIVNSMTVLLPKSENQHGYSLKTSWNNFCSQYGLVCLALDIYFLFQLCFFGIIHSPLFSRDRLYTKYDDIIIYGPVIGSIMCGNLFFYAKYKSSITSRLLLMTLTNLMGDISYAFYSLVEALPKLSVLIIAVVELSATMRLWAGFGIASFAHFYIEIPVYNWGNRKLPKCQCKS